MSRSRSRLALSVAVAATVALAGCSTSHQQAASSSPTTSSAARGGECTVNQKTQPVPTAEKYRPVSPDARISVSLSGIPSGTIKPGDQPAEVEVTLCNNSPVDYPKVGVVFVLTQCSCAIYPSGLPKGTADHYDPATGRWIPLEHPVITTGADYLGGFTDMQPLAKGKQVKLKYRVALDVSMTDGKGAVQATAVVPDDLVQIGKADLPFTVSKQATTPSNAPAARQTVLPFTGLTYPTSVAVDAAGNVYLTDTGNDRVLKLAAGSNDQTVLPFTGLHSPGAVAVDSRGNVYITDYVTAATEFNVPNSRVVKLAVGSNEQTVLPFTGLSHVQDVAVDTAGNVYVANNSRGGDTQVVKLAAGSNDQTVPFTGITSANAVAVDSTGSVYVNDGPNNRVVKLAAGSTVQTVLPLTGLEYPDGIAVDTAGDVYVIDRKNSQVVKVAAGSNDQSAVPSTVLYGPEDVAVDGAGNVYVVDNSGFGQVVKLATS
ncbi:SMP-30/gluconolactonase/LRE family protein [Mycobacterium sp. OAE908]|uniref:NHL repeat-containing protein n=1 Tax=Mycobacterium sp. OAE908 TaxID=2817899 RepID=UPI001AE71355